MASKTYLYKAYKKTRPTINQRIFDGDFEGFDNANFAAYWQGVGTPTIASRGRLDAYGSTNLGTALPLDGLTNYLFMPFTTVAYSFLPKGVNPIVYSTYTYAFWFSKTNWNDGVQQYFVYHTNASAIQGFTLDLNVSTAGLMTLKGNINGTVRTITYALSSITTGQHHIAFGSNGRFLTLWVDSVQVAQFDLGSTSTIGDFDILYNYFGGKVDTLGAVTFPASGVLDDITFYTTYLTQAQVTQIYQTKNPLSTNVGYHFDLNNIVQTTGSFGSFVSETAANNASLTATVAGAYNNTVAGAINLQRSAQVLTNTGGSASQGLNLITALVIPTSSTYTGACYIKAAIGESITLTLTPNGTTTTVTQTIVANGQWQFMSVPITLNSTSTTLNIQVTIANANASAKTLLVDKIALNDGATAYAYFDQNTLQTGSSVYTYDPVNLLTAGTFNVYTYLKTWGTGEVISDPTFELDINSAGSQMEILLARDPTNFGEGFDIDFNIEVRVTAIDSNAPNGTPLFTGYIADYIPDYTNNNVKVIIYSYGADMGNYLSSAGDLMSNQMPINNGSFTGGSLCGYVAIPFIPKVNTPLYAVYIPNTSGINFPISVFKGSPASDSITTISQSTTYNTTNTLIETSSGVRTIGGKSMNVFANTNILYANQQYYFRVGYSNLGFGSTAVIALGATNAQDQANISNYVGFSPVYSLANSTNNVGVGMAINPAFSGAYTEVWLPTGSTTMSFNSMDPSTMLLTIMKDYSAQGGGVIFDTTSIATTGTTVSYTFNAITVLDALNKILDLALANWYYYIDPGTKQLYFKQKALTPKHFFQLGTHIKDFTPEKRTDNMINTVMFTGGLIGNNNLFVKYTNAASIALFGPKLKTYVDNRVTVRATADIIASSLIEENKAPEIRANVVVLDTYDLELIRPGDVVTFRNFAGSSDATSLWDIGLWDQMSWDFDITNPSTLILQIAKYQYLPDTITTTLSTIPPDVNKRIEDINRNLELQQTVNNPSVPQS